MDIEVCKVIENVNIARDTYKMVIGGEFVKKCETPGQFLNIRIGNGREFPLRRPISISEINRQENQVSIVFRINGEGTRHLANLPKGNDIDIIGPLGRGYDISSLKQNQTALLVGGGIGVPPLYELAKQFNQQGIKTIHILGFNTQKEVFYEKEFEALGETYIATIDGSHGVKGFVTDVLKMYQIEFDKYYSCGPSPMLKALTSNIKDKEGFVSIENRMACGIGACYACVCKKPQKTSGKIEYTRVCYDGPVYKVGDVEID